MNNKLHNETLKDIFFALLFALGFILVTTSIQPALSELATSQKNSISDVPSVTANRGISNAGLLSDPPSVINKAWLDSVKKGLIEGEYHPGIYDRQLQAPNRRHNIRTYFEPAGVRVHDRTASGSPELVRLSLARIGHGTGLQSVAAGTVTHRASRVEIAHPGGIVEWYENSAQGLEQGYDITHRPAGTGPLILDIALEKARAIADGEAALFETDNGRRLRYDKLVAVDASGRQLDARIEIPSARHMHLVIADAGARYPLVIDPLLTAVPDSIIESNDPDLGSFDSSTFGGKIASAGDVNGDGFADIIIGARGWDNGLFDEGAAFVFLGGPGGIAGTDPTTANAVILSSVAAAEFGVSVAGAGDVNGDGFDDVIVGSNLYPGVLPGTALRVDGAAFIFHGGPTGITATSPDQANARIEANQLSSFLGFSVAGAGDVNGDGFGDIIIGVPRQGSPTFPPNIPVNQGQGTGGAALVFHGSAAGITGTGFPDADAILLPYPAGLPEPSGTFMGTYVSSAGDVNGDGFDDVLVNALGTAVFLGSASGIVGTDPTTAHTLITGAGPVVAAAGDVNGDGFGDIITGHPTFPDITAGLPLSNSGNFAVFHGGLNGITATDISQAQTQVQGEITEAQLGRAVDSAGDIDNDGFDDIIVGALSFSGSLLREGAAYVFRGGPAGITATTLSDALVRLQSNQMEAVRRLNRYELDVAGLGDVNNDGFADVALGLGFYDAGELNEGAAFIYLGGNATGTPNLPPVANAGPDQVVVDVNNAGSVLITVDGSLSFDPDGTLVSYAWQEGATLLGTTPLLTTTLTATGDHTLVLTVTDDGGLTRGDPVIVRVEPAAVLPPVVDTFTAAPASITAGAAATLDWTTTDATSVTLDNGVGLVAVDGSTTVSPLVTTSYTLTATGNGGTVTASQTVTVLPASSETLTITNLEFRANRSEWRIAGTSSIPGPGNSMTLFAGPTVAGSPLLGTAVVDTLGNWSFRQRNAAIPPDSTGMISIQSSQGGIWEGISGIGPVTGSNPPPPPPPAAVPSVDSFIATPASITTGGSATLAWSTTDASSITISGVAAGLAVDGSVTVSPTSTTTYTLTATGTGGTATGSVTVAVNPTMPPATQATVSLSGPASVVRGQQATFTVTLVNNGTATLTGVQLSFAISPNRRFKGISPAGLQALADIPPGSSVSQVWSGQADKEGMGTVTAEAFSNGGSVDVATQALTVVK